MMGTLGRWTSQWRCYVARCYAGMILLTLMALVVLVVAASMVEKVGDLTRQPTGGSTALHMALLSSVEYGYAMLPVACFLATLAVGTWLAHRGDIRAVQTAGGGPWYLASPLVAVAVGMAALGGACGHAGVPKALAARQRAGQGVVRQGDAWTSFYGRRSPWFQQEDMLLYLPAVDTDTATFYHPVMYRFQDGLIQEVIEAQALHHGPQGWWFQEAVLHAMDKPDVQTWACLPVALRITPRQVMDVTGYPRQMPTQALAQLIARRRQSGLDTTAHRMEFHTRWAFPFSTLGLVLLALPWAVQPHQPRSLAVTLGAGAVAMAVDLAMDQLCRLLVLTHTLAPPWGAWGTPLVCGFLIPLNWFWTQRHP